MSRVIRAFCALVVMTLLAVVSASGAQAATPAAPAPQTAATASAAQAAPTLVVQSANGSYAKKCKGGKSFTILKDQKFNYQVFRKGKFTLKLCAHYYYGKIVVVGDFKVTSPTKAVFGAYVWFHTPQAWPDEDFGYHQTGSFKDGKWFLPRDSVRCYVADHCRLFVKVQLRVKVAADPVFSGYVDL